MSILLQTALRVQSHLDEEHVPFCFIGGLAVQYWGEPRVTRDVDAGVFVELGGEEGLVDYLLKVVPARVDRPG